MATEYITTMVDDLDAQPYEHGETVTFGIDGKSYEVDLRDENAAALRDALAVYVGVARVVTSGAVRRPQRAPKAASNVQEMRRWLREHGYPVKEKGRIPADLREKYDTRESLEPAKPADTDTPAAPKGDLPPATVVKEPSTEEGATDRDVEAPGDESDDKIIDWHREKGYKLSLTTDQRPNGLMKSRYRRAHRHTA